MDGTDRCEHYETATVFEAPKDIPGCTLCLEQGDTWVHLRMCLHCGLVACCDSSPNRHARSHNESSGHHVFRSVEPGESWAYCFHHDEMTLLED